MRSADGLHDLLLRIGDLTREEMGLRSTGDADAHLDALVAARRAIDLPVAGEIRVAAVEDASRFRDALGTPLPPGLPEALLTPVADPLGDLTLRFARTHGPFTAAAVSARFGLPPAAVEAAVKRYVAAGRLHEGAFTPGVQRP